MDTLDAAYRMVASVLWGKETDFTKVDTTANQQIHIDRYYKHTLVLAEEILSILCPDETARPTIVCLCGSTRYWQTFQVANLTETLAGKIVLSIGAATGTDEEHFDNLPPEEYDRVKSMLDELHLRKIDLADEVLILDVQGYIGDSTARELAYAQAKGKRIRFYSKKQ